jgi:hypothetical protein
MFYPYYSAIKSRLIDQVETIQDVQKFNDQYSGSNLSEVVALIEFPDRVATPYVSKTTQRASVDICVHLVSKVVSDKDNYVPDEQYKTHDDLVDSVATALREYQLVYDEASLAKPLQVTGYQELTKVRGWLITKIFLATKD